MVKTSRLTSFWRLYKFTDYSPQFHININQTSAARSLQYARPLKFQYVIIFTDFILFISIINPYFRLKSMSQFRKIVSNSLVMSVFPSARPPVRPSILHGKMRLPHKNFLETSYIGFLLKFVDTFPFWLNSDMTSTLHVDLRKTKRNNSSQLSLVSSNSFVVYQVSPICPDKRHM